MNRQKVRLAAIKQKKLMSGMPRIARTEIVAERRERILKAVLDYFKQLSSLKTSQEGIAP
jgi:hypothetical protein